MEDAGDNKYIDRITELTSGFGEFVATVNPDTIDENEKDRIVTAMEKFVESLKNSGSSSAAESNLDSVSESASMPDQTIFGKYDKFKGGLVERQEDGLGCGRHALNNLFGDVYFTAYTDEGAYTIDEIKEAVEKLSTDNPLDLQRLCGYLYAHPFSGIESVNVSDDTAIDDLLCPENENYNVTVLVAALRFLGYNLQIDNLGKLSRIINQPDTFGILINTGGHWITVRKYEGKIYKLDSLIKTAVEFSDIDKIYTKSIIVVKDFDEVYRKTYIGVEKMYNAISGIKEKALDKDFIMNWIRSLQNLFPDNVQSLYESTIENIDDAKSDQILEKLTELENAMDPYSANLNATQEDIEAASENSKKFNKELLELLVVNGSPAVVGESKEQEAEGKSEISDKTARLDKTISELEAKIGDLEEKAKAKAKAAGVKLEVVKEDQVEPLGRIAVTDKDIGSQDLNLQPKSLQVGNPELSAESKDEEEIEMIELNKPAVALPFVGLGQAPPAAAATAAARPVRGIKKRDSTYNKDTVSSNLKRAEGQYSGKPFPGSLRDGKPGFGGNTRRRNHKTRRSHTLKNKKQK